jgi:putative ABC transport system permease protein
VDPGVKPANVLTFRISPSPAQFPKEADIVAFYDHLLGQLGSLPGVRAVGATSWLPLTGMQWSGDSTIEGRPPDDYITEVRHKTVSAGYFDAAGLRLDGGRGFASSDTADAGKVIIVNQALARRYFAREGAVGRRITFSKPGHRDDWRTIVGVIQDERQDGLAHDVKPEIYEPLAQSPRSGLHVVLRSSDGTDPEALIAPARQTIRQLNPSLVMEKVQTFDTLVATSVSPQRFAMLLMSAFAVLALLLAVIGVYGVVSYNVKQRTAEIGVRLALGASPRQVSRLILVQSLAPVIAGLVAGLLLASLATRFLATQLFEVSPIDPATFSIVAMILLAAAVLASVVPARRAMRIDPVDALRAE